MKVRRFYRPGAICVDPAERLREAGIKMRRAALSCLPVVEDGRFVGIVTERDFVEAAANGVPPTTARVADYTHDGAVSVTLDDESTVAQVKMLAIGCRHLPVVDAGRLVGLVSARDLYLMQARVAYEPRVPVVAGGWPQEAAPDADSEN